LLAALERDRHWDSLFRATLDTISDGILVVDKKGSVTHVNRRANKLIYNDRFVTSAPKELKAPMEKVMRSGEAVYDELIEFNDHKMTASFLPLRDEDDNMVISVQEVEHIHKIERKVRQKLANKGLVAKNSFDMLYANGQELQEAVRTAKQYAVVDSSVLICGETGTGKEMFAQSIHNYSSRRDEAFVAVNCATIAPNLLESELFGYVEGAFTGAKRGGKIGLFELAHKGTIFLDEIGETSLEMQARLLRVLEEHEIMRVGDDKVIPVDIRVIAATNRDLQQMVEEGKFRSDFYYRLDVLALHLPPLRVCRENIVPLIKHFNSKYSERHAKHSLDFTDESLEVFKNYGWPGNVRELKNVIERLVVTNRGDIVDADAARTALHIKKESNSKPMQEASDKGLMNAAEMELIRNVLKECGGNKTAAAKKLGISRPTLHRKLKLMEAGDDA
jgi:transcriptional regulator with PAS, ATPase and Fis domain